MLKPGGVFAGTDSTGRPRLGFALLHLGDTKVLVEPHGLPARLAAAGFADVSVAAGREALRFTARRPS